MQTMQENMKTKRGMGGSMMMGGHKTIAGGDMMQHHAMMETRTNMMEFMMMKQMVQPDQITANFLITSGIYFLSEPLNSSLGAKRVRHGSAKASNRNPHWEQQQAN
jgi:hypothetical protein